MCGDNDDDYDYHSGARIGKHYDDDDDGDQIPVFQFLYGWMPPIPSLFYQDRSRPRARSGPTLTGTR